MKRELISTRIRLKAILEDNKQVRFLTPSYVTSINAILNYIEDELDILTKDYPLQARNNILKSGF